MNLTFDSFWELGFLNTGRSGPQVILQDAECLYCQGCIPPLEGPSSWKERGCKKKQATANMSKDQHLCFIIPKLKKFLPAAKEGRQMEHASAFQAVWLSAVMLWQTCGPVLWEQYTGEVRGKIPTAIKWKSKFSRVCLEGAQKLVSKSQWRAG